MSLPTDDTIAQYPLIHCTIADFVFERGVVTFAQLAIELHLIFTQAEESESGSGEPVVTETSLMPLVISYESLLSIKVPGKKYIQLSSPSDIIQSWASMNEMQFPEGTFDDSDVTSITLDLELEYISEIWKEVAPTISANRRARSSSRWSATELLPLKPFTVAIASQAPSAVAAVPGDAAAECVNLAAADDPKQQQQPHLAQEASIHHASHSAPSSQPGVSLCDDAVAQANGDDESPSEVAHVPTPPQVESVAIETPVNALMQTPDESAVRLPRRALRRPDTPESSSLPSSIAMSPPAATTAVNKNATRPTPTRVLLDDSTLYRPSVRVTTLSSALETAAISTPAATRQRDALTPTGATMSSCFKAKKHLVKPSAADSSDDDDVPLGALLGNAQGATKPSLLASLCVNVGKKQDTTQKPLEESQTVKYDFCDLSSPHEIKAAVSAAPPIKGKRTSGRSSGGSSRPSAGSRSTASTKRKSVTIDEPVVTVATPNIPAPELPSASAPAPDMPTIKPIARKKPTSEPCISTHGPTMNISAQPTSTVHNEPISLNGGAVCATPHDEESLQHINRRAPSRVRMPTPSLARPSMARPLPEKCGPVSKGALVSNDDADATSLKKLLDCGLGENNLEEFMRSAVRLGKRAKQAKRQREESVMSCGGATPGDLVELARCATELLQICAEERDARRAKYFRYFTKRIAGIVDQCGELGRQLEGVTKSRDAMLSDLQLLASSLAADQLRWDAVERDDVDTAVASIHEKLVVSPH